MTNQDQKLIDPSDMVYSERTETFSTWKNTNDKKATFRLLTNEKRAGKHPKEGANCKGSVFLRVEIEPGQTRTLPSEYDQAIRKVDQKTGQVVGGLCPWLTKTGEEEIVVHKSLDYKSAFLNEEALNLVKTLAKEEELRNALKVLEDRKAADEAKKNPVGRPKKE
jgi:hypothetical protein